MLSCGVYDVNLYGHPDKVLEYMVWAVLFCTAVIHFATHSHVNGILAKTLPHHQFLKWDIDHEDELDTECPAELVPEWRTAVKEAGDKNDKVMQFFSGTTQPTRQEAMWPFWRNGPDFFLGLAQVCVFFLIVTLSVLCASGGGK